MDISTTYLGIKLSSPVVMASSGLSETPDQIKKSEDNGAGAVILKSLFEEQIMLDVNAQQVNNIYDGFPESEAYALYYSKKHNTEQYLNLIRKAKEQTNIPIIASINCVSASDWINYAKMIEEAGADALELNVFILPADPYFDNNQIEQIYFDIANKITRVVQIPVTIKISSYFSSLTKFAIDLSKTGIKGLVLFNRFYSPDVDINEMKIKSGHIFSSCDDISHTIRWIGILSDQVACDLAATTGIHKGYDVVKVLLVGAKIAQVATTVYKHGYKYIDRMNEEIHNWMKINNFNSIEEFRGKLSQKNIKSPMLYERSQFMKYFSEFHQ